MTGEIYSTYQEGATLYAVVRRQSDGFVNIIGGDTYEAWVDGNIANYVVALTDHDGDYYSADFPATITEEESFVVYIFVQIGGSPADGDWVLSQAYIGWDGGEEITIITLNTGLTQANNIFEEPEALDERSRILYL